MFICYHYYEKQTHSETYIYLIYISNITAQLPKRIKTSTTGLGTTASVTELSTMNKNTTSRSSQNDFTHSLKLT